ncbi:hypothetical protein DSL72_004643 [Monilinia vaccinii-corymbosi]|uniref:Uncharacterized protein n=1 Tax=Monilinia vaccinii-corymbosi TaxID=61207 RepID=A0A8A3NX79_9HELO|nr:hypothetical protein DSL72_004643 [Monilinia vaccinii-corymbosi]
MSSRTNRKLSPLTSNWNNRSQSSINSDAAVFYSAQAHPTPIELEQRIPQSYSSRSPKMDRQDSGFAESIAYIPSHLRKSSRPSSKSSSHNAPRPSLNSTRKESSRSKDSSGNSSSASSSTSRSTRRHSSRSPRLSTSQTRPNLSSRHHQSRTKSSSPPPQYQYFHFPSLSDDLSQETSNVVATPPPPPPATVHYWTSDQTRRLEYAAIDAASKGIRGFVRRCIPDCFLSVEKRGSRFCEENMRERDGDAGSVRRYRLVMEDDTENEIKGGAIKTKVQSVKQHRRRWSSFIRRQG